MLYFLDAKKDCTGCSACKNICPVNCISMIEDEEGFNYPVADDRCISCAKCELICPIKNKKNISDMEIKQYAAAAITKNPEVWAASSSGGAFTEICNAYGDSETIIFGARFDGLKVIHDHVVGVENIGMFRKSKYVQSSVTHHFTKAKEFLELDKRVIFTGTPCQIAGLRAYLNKEYVNLLCVDLICHGVGSPKVFQSSIEYYERIYKKKIKEYSFRNRKTWLGNVKIYVSEHKLDDRKSRFVDRDVYCRLFLSQLCLRPSCGGNCKFRTSNRFGDITIADFKNKEAVLPHLKDHRNYSTIVVNSKKGDEVFKKLSNKMDILRCAIDDVKKYNPLFYRHTTDNKFRNEFFKDYQDGLTMDALIDKYVSNQKPRFKQRIAMLIPYGFKNWYRNHHN